VHASEPIWKNEVGGAYDTMGETRGAYRVFVRKPEGRRTFGRSLHRSEYDIKMDRKQNGKA